MVKELIIILMEMYLKEIGSVIKLTDLVYLMGLKLCIKVNGKMAYLMEKESIDLMIHQNMKDNSVMVNLMEEENLPMKFYAIKEFFMMV